MKTEFRWRRRFTGEASTEDYGDRVEDVMGGGGSSGRGGRGLDEDDDDNNGNGSSDAATMTSAAMPMMRRHHQRARPWKGLHNVDAVCRRSR